MTAATSQHASAVQPQDGNFHVPAEEAPHARTWMCWPSTPSIYGGGGYFESVQETLGRLAATISQHEPVSMLAASKHHALARELCGPDVTLVDIPTDDMWARDSGPVFVKNDFGELGLVDLNFNGWGNKQRHTSDKHIPASIAAYSNCHYLESAITGEGGGLEYDGDGTLILTDSCWVNDNRNPGVTQDTIETELKRLFGAGKVIWLPGVRGRDITDGHIDGSIRFVRPGLLMTGGYPGDTSEWGRFLDEAKEILSKETDAQGRPFEMVDIPSAIDVRSTHRDLFTGYANFYIGNDAIYTPEFGDKNADAHAFEMLDRLFPDRKIIALEVDRIYENGGGIHCVTQQEPA